MSLSHIYVKYQSTNLFVRAPVKPLARQ